eukprot:109458-Chlamydomonas_euryale.AAC.2
MGQGWCAGAAYQAGGPAGSAPLSMSNRCWKNERVSVRKRLKVLVLGRHAPCLLYSPGMSRAGCHMPCSPRMACAGCRMPYSPCMACGGCRMPYSPCMACGGCRPSGPHPQLCCRPCIHNSCAPAAHLHRDVLPLHIQT